MTLLFPSYDIQRSSLTVGFHGHITITVEHPYVVYSPQRFTINAVKCFFKIYKNCSLRTADENNLIYLVCASANRFFYMVSSCATQYQTALDGFFVTKSDWRGSPLYSEQAVLHYHLLSQFWIFVIFDVEDVAQMSNLVLH